LKYLPWHSVLEHPQPVFFCDCEWPSSTPIHGNMQIFRQKLGMQQIPNWMIWGISRI
jgi:hypothetical protein